MLEDAKLKELAGALQGELLTPESPAYDETRALWNGMIDRRPALIVRCRSADDVVAAVNFARDNRLQPAARGGGHGVAGHAVPENGLMIDLSLMNGVEVDSDARIARVGSGATLGDMDGKTQEYGLATTGGVDSRTGVAGLTLGGGIGWLVRSFGLSLDNVVAFEVVTADGKLRRANESDHPDLYWGLRGGGGRLGVVTSFEFQLHPVGPDVAVAQIFHPYEGAADALRFYRDFMAQAPDQLGCSAMVMTVPPTDPFPESHHGKTAVAFVGCYSGAVEEGMRQLEGLKAHGQPILEAVQPMSYVTLQQSFNEAAPDGARYYWKSQFLKELSDAAIDTLVGHVEQVPGAFSAIGIEGLGGATGRVDSRATAFPHRDAPFNLGIWGGWSEPADDSHVTDWVRGLNDAMKPYSTGGSYANYLDADEQERMPAVFGDNHSRLQEIKKKYDPENLFRLN